MPKGKLILICQAGGEFVTNSDGTLTYNGGDAHAVNINPETLFDDLKLKLAEMCNLEYESLSMKYFIPGNNRTLINISSDRDLKRMYDFHGNSVTADVYITGKEGFSQEHVYTHASRASGIKQAEAVTSNVAKKKAASASLKSAKAVNLKRQKLTAVKRTRARLVTSEPAADTAAGVGAVDVDAEETDDEPIVLDMNATPADTVKKRRRKASRKLRSNGPATDTVGVVRKKKKACYKYETDVSLVEAYDVDMRNVSLDELVTSWKDRITGVGQDFNSAAEFRDALQKYAVAHRFGYRLKKNDLNRVSAVCVIEGCSWKLNASSVPSEEVFRIKNMCDTHTCGDLSWKAAHTSKSWLVSIIKSRFGDSPHYKPKEISKRIFEDFGIQVNYMQLCRAIREIRGKLQIPYKEAYNQLPSFCEQLEVANPGSFAKLFTDNDKRFQRLFVSFNASIHGFQNGCRPLLVLDSTPLKSKYHEILLTATALDGDDAFFPVAFAVVDVENSGNWHWFLEQLRSVISSSRCLTFVSDKEKGLSNMVLEVFLNAHHGYSLYHLLEDFRRNLTGDGKISLVGAFVDAAHATQPEDFKLFSEKIKQVSSKAYNWLIQSQPEYWANALFKGEKYDVITTDVAESYSKWLDEVEEQNITQKVEAIIHNMMDLAHQRQTDSKLWSSKLTPSKELILQEDIEMACSMRALFSADTIFEVQGRLNNVVNMEKKECTCGWDVTRNPLPCSHIIAVCNRIGKCIYDFCSQYFTAEYYRIAYLMPINPVEFEHQMEENEEESVLPPATSRTPDQDNELSRRRKKLKKIMSCSICKGEGHNKSTCKENIRQQPAENIEQQHLSLESTEQQPSENVEQQPLASDSMERQPPVALEDQEQQLSETVEQQPSETVEQQPSETVEQQPSETVEQQPSKNVEQQPLALESIEQRPSALENTKQQPSENVEQPLESTEQQPLENVEQQLFENAEHQHFENEVEEQQQPLENVEQHPANISTQARV